VDEPPPPVARAVPVELEDGVAAALDVVRRLVLREVDHGGPRGVRRDALQPPGRVLLGGVALAAVGDDVAVVVDEPPPPVARAVFVALERRLARGRAGLDVARLLGPLDLDFEAYLAVLALDLDLELGLRGRVDGHRPLLVDRDRLPAPERPRQPAEVRGDPPPAAFPFGLVDRLLRHT